MSPSSLTLALMYQSCVKLCTDLNAGIMLRKDALAIHENFIYDQSQQMTQQVLKKNAETDHH